jgi:competence protein ComFA
VVKSIIARQFQVYMYIGQQGINFGLTDDPLFLFQWLEQHEQGADSLNRPCSVQEAQKRQYEYAILSPPLPLWLAELALGDARKAFGKVGARSTVKSVGGLLADASGKGPGAGRGLECNATVIRKMCLKAVSAIKKSLAQWDLSFSGYGYPMDYCSDRFSSASSAMTSPLIPPQSPPPMVADRLPAQEVLAEYGVILSGRVLLEEEALGEIRKLQRSANERVLTALVLSGKATAAAAVGIGEFGRPVCRRCGERSRIVFQNCPHCGRHCFLCLTCIGMGEARSCKTLYTFSSDIAVPQQQRPPAAKPLEPFLSVQLTAAQQQAASELTRLFKEGCREALVWAVCGAGKTEVAFDIMAAALNAGLRILYTVPRRDVVRELASRIRAAFGQDMLTELPLSDRGFLPGTPILIATTHQVLRFANAFDLVVLDEADAFPYYGSEMLLRGLQRALGRNAMLIYMTATPDATLRKQVASGKTAAVHIPARHHGHPLAVPALHRVTEAEWSGIPGKLPRAVGEFLEETLRRNAVALVFVPTVQHVELVGQALAGFAARHHVTSDYIHSGREGRTLVVARFRERKIRLLASTTLLERGITVPFTDVAVLYADHRIFDARALIQMAGRAGRDRRDPVGRVGFFSNTVSHEMQEARSLIISMNEEAGKRGYLLQF